MLALAYGARVKWTIGSALLFLGVLGWTIGGIGAVIDSTIAANTRFHNTLWVAAHFHTYLPDGRGADDPRSGVPCLPGPLAAAGTGGRRAADGRAVVPGRIRLPADVLSRRHYSVPRRYASYPPELAQGVTFARVAVVFILLFLSGLALYSGKPGDDGGGPLPRDECATPNSHPPVRVVAGGGDVAWAVAIWFAPNRRPLIRGISNLPRRQSSSTIRCPM